MASFTREFAMPSGETFTLLPVSKLLDRWLVNRLLVVDPFARNSKRGTVTNDLSLATSADSHMHAEDFTRKLIVNADGVLFDPPYSPRQIMECYQQIGRVCGKRDTQTAHLYKTVKDELTRVLKPGGVAICCGWNSVGFGVNRGFDLVEVLLVTHGAAHNDTIVTVEIKK